MDLARRIWSLLVKMILFAGWLSVLGNATETWRLDADISTIRRTG
jgi:hypothetical protein